METNKFIFPPYYKIRSTDEKVEVTAFNQVECGRRNDSDWVTYIDSEGKEHIKENLNLELDFQAVNELTNMMKDPIFKSMPSTRNTRVFEMTKALVEKGMLDADECVKKAIEIVDKIDEYDL